MNSNSNETETKALVVKDLKVYYNTDSGQVKAVDGVSFTLDKGERLGLVGESGSGKTTMATAIMRMTRSPAEIVGGSIYLDGKDILSLSEDEIRRIYLSEISLVPQGAMNSLNPVIRIGEQIKDGVIDHINKPSSKSELNSLVSDLLNSVGLDARVANMYPHELSGGMKQRVALAISTSLKPKIILADEPTSALDVVVQRQIMATLEKIQTEIGAAVILVGHDMGLMAQFVDTLGVMYAGKLVELAKVEDIFANPLHPYTKLLISSLPDLEEKRKFFGIPGLPPNLINPPSGCYFHPRCPSVMEVCRTTPSPVSENSELKRVVSCHLYSQITEESRNE